MTTPKKRPRVAIFGGDGRAERVDWPSGYDLQFYPGSTYSKDGWRRLRTSVQAGRIDHIITIVRFLGHSDDSNAKSLGLPMTRWPNGVSELAKRIEELTGMPPGDEDAASVSEDAWIDAANAAVDAENGSKPMVTEDDVRTLALAHGDSIVKARRAAKAVAEAEAMLLAVRKDLEEAVAAETVARTALEEAAAKL